MVKVISQGSEVVSEEAMGGMLGVEVLKIGHEGGEVVSEEEWK